MGWKPNLRSPPARLTAESDPRVKGSSGGGLGIITAFNADHWIPGSLFQLFS